MLNSRLPLQSLKTSLKLTRKLNNKLIVYSLVNICTIKVPCHGTYFFMCQMNYQTKDEPFGPPSHTEEQWAEKSSIIAACKMIPKSGELFLSFCVLSLKDGGQ